MTTAITLNPLSGQISAARAAQVKWAALPVRRRLQGVERFRRLLVDESDRVCALIGQEVGKSAAEVISGEVLPIADGCVYLRKEAERALRAKAVTRHGPLWMTGSRHVIHRRPRGVRSSVLEGSAVDF